MQQPFGRLCCVCLITSRCPLCPWCTLCCEHGFGLLQEATGQITGQISGESSSCRKDSNKSVLAYNYVALQVTEWQSSKAVGGSAMSTRKVLFKGSAVLLAGSLNVNDFLQACREQPVVFEVSRLLLPCGNHAFVFVHVCNSCMLLSGSVCVAWFHTYSTHPLYARSC